MKEYNYVKIQYKNEIKDWPIIHLAELNEERFEVRAIDIYQNNGYGYANTHVECNSFLSDCTFPIVSEFYNSNKYDLNEADYYDITKEEFETEWKKALEYCNIHNMIPRVLP